MFHFQSYFVLLSLVLLLSNCDKDKTPIEYKTENVVVIIVDGPRYSETWGKENQEFIPHMKFDMAPEGVVFTNFRNNGPTYTNSGHTAVLTGFYQIINSGGGEKPKRLNVMQYWLRASEANANKAWLFGSKDKVEPLANCLDMAWADQFVPRTDCGMNGVGTGYRTDSITVLHVIDSMEMHKPNLVFINLREPDFSAHTGIWDDYISTIRQVDKDYYAIWHYLQNSPHYKDNTTLFITNDHGRHLDSVGSFANHGDACEGCQHINLFAAGPDFKNNEVNPRDYELIDIPSTIAELLHIQMSSSDGRIIKDLFHE
jgi:hypothetical protein